MLDRVTIRGFARIPIRFFGVAVVTAFVLSLLVVALPILADIFLKLEFLTFDVRCRLFDSDPPASRVRKQIAIVEISHTTFETLRARRNIEWPFNRRLYADAIDRLTALGASVIGIDVFFSEPRGLSGDPEQDRVFAEAVARSKRVVLADGATEPLLPVLEQAALATGRIAQPLSVDGVVRMWRAWALPLAPGADPLDASNPHLEILPGRGQPTFDLRVVEAHRGMRDHFALDGRRLLVPARLESSGAGASGVLLRPVPLQHGGHLFCPYLSKDFFTIIPFESVLDGTVAAGDVAGKIVLIGATAPVLHDVFPTPYEASVPGVIIHARAIASILDGRYLIPLSRFYPRLDLSTIGATLGAVALLGGLHGAIRPLPGILIAFGLSTGWLFVSALVFRLQGLVLPVAFPMAAYLAVFVAVSYKSYVEKEREKQEIKAIFKQYVTEDVVNLILEQPEILALGGVRKDLTVLFADIRSFTNLSEKRSPEEIVELLNEFFEDMNDVIFRHRGTLDKYLGDGIMVIFGAPVSQADNAARAVRCALEMVRRTADLNRRRAERGTFEIAGIGVGISSGEVIVGNVGSAKHKEYTVIGDHVNLAARIVAIAAPGEVLISENTAGLLDPSIGLTPREPVLLKGKAHPVPLYGVEPEN